jgi:hypothetical protein
MSDYRYVSKGGGSDDNSAENGNNTNDDDDVGCRLLRDRTSQRPEASAAALAVPTATAIETYHYVDVIAPASLPEGYQFDTIIDTNHTMNVTVPRGGVTKGQKFSAPIRNVVVGVGSTGMSVVATKVTDTTGNCTRTTNDTSTPVGHWRDDILGCFNYGVCHPHWWTACCCPLGKILYNALCFINCCSKTFFFGSMSCFVCIVS